MQTLLDTSAITAFRLALDSGKPSDRVPMIRMFSAWNAINPLGPKQKPADLPDTMRHEGEFVISTTTYEPLCLSEENALSEIFRLSGLRREPEKDGWHNLSIITRTATGIGFDRHLKESDPPQGFTAYLRKHQMVEMRKTRAVLYVRPVDGKEPDAFIPVTITAMCPMDTQPRQLESKPSFGAGYQALIQHSTDLIAHKTKVKLCRGSEERHVYYHAHKGIWLHETGEIMKRRDPGDPVLHSYKHGMHVGSLIGFVSQSKSGQFFANVGIPVDSPGDDDALIFTRGRAKAETFEEAMAILEQRDDLDHIFRKTKIYNHQMGFWLSGL